MPIGGCLLTTTHFQLCDIQAIFYGLRLVRYIWFRSVVVNRFRCHYFDMGDNAQELQAELDALRAQKQASDAKVTALEAEWADKPKRLKLPEGQGVRRQTVADTISRVLQRVSGRTLRLGESQVSYQSLHGAVTGASHPW